MKIWAFFTLTDRMGQMDAAARWAHVHRIPGQARTRPQIATQTDRIRTKRTSVWGRAVELALKVHECISNDDP